MLERWWSTGRSPATAAKAMMPWRAPLDSGAPVEQQTNPAEEEQEGLELSGRTA
ncbi:MAG: hypothetical protein HYR88_00410 [Verrucomicrobia bacterium]|nr:hypothetical protein [Verrucomicrobiota bacterium]